MLAPLLVVVAHSAAVAADLRARDVRDEYARTPVAGVAVRRPRFSRALEHAPAAVLASPAACCSIDFARWRAGVSAAARRLAGVLPAPRHAERGAPASLGLGRRAQQRHAGCCWGDL